MPSGSDANDKLTIISAIVIKHLILCAVPIF